MKYVKLFESWLHTVNEGLSQKFIDEANKYMLDIEKPYARTKETLAKEIVKLVDQLTKGEVKLTAKVEGSDKISLYAEAPSKFTFICKSTKDFSSISRLVIKNLSGSETTDRSSYVNILSIEGKATAGTNYSDNTTIAQFLSGIMGSTELTDSSEQDCEDAIESLLQSSMGKAPKLAGKKAANTISKMTVDQFNELTDKQIDIMFDLLSKINKVKAFDIIRAKDSGYYFVNVNPKFAKEQGITFKKYNDEGSGDLGGRHMVFQLRLGDAKPEDSIADAPVSYGTTNYKESTSFGKIELEDAVNKTRLNSTSTVYAGGQADGSTTLAGLIFGLRKFIQDGLKDQEGKKVADSFDSLVAMENQVKEANVKASSEAWKKEGGPADMSLNISGSSEESKA